MREDLITTMSFMEFVGGLADVCGAVGGVAAIALWVAARRTRQLAQELVKISLRIEGEGREIALPLEIIRRDVSRAELLGRIGMLPMRKPGARFALRELGTPAVMRAINAVSRAETNALVIPATREEVEQFDL
ncbi:MAG TPA: hypothetical protein VEC13_02100 [Candidatus Paceibacterota bacterium]|nr:hypothetical protein [Candidatus Paceibacterota bacterium]